MSWKSAVDSGESAGSPLQVTSHCWCVILLLKTQELALTVIFTRGGTGCCMMQCVPSNPTAEEAVQFVLVLALCAEDNPPDCRVSATKTSAVIIKTQRIKLACGKNRKRCSPENNLSLLLQDVHWSMPEWLQVFSTYYNGEFQISHSAERLKHAGEHERFLLHCGNLLLQQQQM